MRIIGALLRLVGTTDTKCPGEAEFLAYAENRLASRNRARFERHSAECDDCLEMLAFLGRESVETGTRLSDKLAYEQTERVLSIIKSDERKRSKPARREKAAAGFSSPELAPVGHSTGFSISYPRLAAAGLVVCAILVGSLYLLTGNPTSGEAGMEALRLAVKDERYIRPRISGGFEYSRYSATRGENRRDELQFSRALRALEPAQNENAPVNDRLVLARAYLALGTSEDTRRALAILTQLAARGVETPEALNDMGVAQFQLGNNDEAIAYFNKALSKAPNYNEALFNQALAAEVANRDGKAREHWQQFISQSSDDGWKSEAATKLSGTGR